MNLLKNIFDWSAFWGDLNEAGIDAVFYFFFAFMGTFLFLIKLALSIFFGGDADVDLGLDGADLDADFDASESFNLLSIQSFLAFFMGTGWMGLIARFDWELSRIATGIAAALFGFGLMSLSAWLMMMMKKLEQTSEYDLKTAIGHTGRVYMNIPEKGQGAGQVEVSVSGRKKILNAISDGTAVASFTSVKVIDVRDDETLIISVNQD